MPQISVIIPCYNAEAFIDQSIKSVLQQSHDDFEIILVDDGSTDSTSEIIKSAAKCDPRIRYLCQKHRGIVYALNSALSISDSKFVARLDADDLMHPHRLAIQSRFLLDNPTVDVIGSSLMVATQSGRIYKRVVFPRCHSAIANGLQEGRWVIAHPSVMYRRQKVCSLNFYSDEYRHAEDLELWLRLLRNNAIFANLVMPLTTFRTHGNNDTFINSKKQSEARQRALSFHYLGVIANIEPINDKSFIQKQVWLSRLINEFEPSCVFHLPIEIDLKAMCKAGYLMHHLIFSYVKNQWSKMPYTCCYLLFYIFYRFPAETFNYLLYYTHQVIPVQFSCKIFNFALRSMSKLYSVLKYLMKR